MKTLLIVTAATEAGTGLALMVLTSVTVKLLLGSSVDSPSGTTVGRVAGAALLALGVACWLVRHDGQSPAATGLVASMLLYNIATIAILTSAGVTSKRFGPVLWPAVVLHAALAVWCIACLR